MKKLFSFKENQSLFFESLAFLQPLGLIKDLESKVKMKLYANKNYFEKIKNKWRTERIILTARRIAFKDLRNLTKMYKAFVRRISIVKE